MGKSSVVLCVVLTGVLVGHESDAAASASSIRRELRRMVGYTIISSDSVAEVSERRDGGKDIQLLSGTVFRIDGFVLGPLAASDVVIFAKAVPDDMKRRFSALPSQHHYFYKLLIDDEIVDASFAR